MSVLTAHRADMCYCPGCSHGSVLEQLGRALDGLKVPADRLCIVSDIGCIGTADRYFACHTFHGLHGRSITYAEGIKRRNPELLVVVLIGDGGCGIGTAHLVHAARRGADIKVVVCNNFNFGMTGGQHSPTTPFDARTSTTPGGAPDRPFDVCRTVAVNGAAFAARLDSFDPTLGELLQAALSKPGFVLLDIWELCTAYFVPANKLNRGSLATYSEELQLPFGVVHECDGISRNQANVGPKRPAPPRHPDRVVDGHPALPWRGRREFCVAGSAGQRIRSAVGLIGEIAVQCGLFAAQQDDFPITVRRGFSISNLVVSTEPIRYTAVDSPDLVVILSADGRDRCGPLTHLSSQSLVVVASDVALSETPARVQAIDLKSLERKAGKESAALAALTYAIALGEFTNTDALEAASAALEGPFRDSNRNAVREGIALFKSGSRFAEGASKKESCHAKS